MAFTSYDAGSFPEGIVPKRPLRGFADELDVICSKTYEKSICELKHYSESKITKDMIFIF